MLVHAVLMVCNASGKMPVVCNVYQCQWYLKSACKWENARGNMPVVCYASGLRILWYNACSIQCQWYALPVVRLKWSGFCSLIISNAIVTDGNNHWPSYCYHG